MAFSDREDFCCLGLGLGLFVGGLFGICSSRVEFDVVRFFGFGLVAVVMFLLIVVSYFLSCVFLSYVFWLIF